jgi:hypothetical protein
MPILRDASGPANLEQLQRYIREHAFEGTLQNESAVFYNGALSESDLHLGMCYAVRLARKRHTDYQKLLVYSRLEKIEINNSMLVRIACRCPRCS